MNSDRDKEEMPNKYHKLLTIAGSDSGGGAGIQADLKTFSALGCYGMTAITALTAQNTVGVTGIHAIPPSFVEEQLEAVLSDIGVDAVKIGMLYSVELVESVVYQLKKYNVRKIVMDPVMVAQSGDKLLKDDAIEAIREMVMPLAMVLTPNLAEARVLLNKNIQTVEEMKTGAKELSVYGSQSVLIKGGHLKADQDCTDILYLSADDRYVVLSGERIDTHHTHGTGCTLSSAIAAYLANDYDIETAVTKAKNYITEAIRFGADYVLGMGNGPIHHFFEFWR